MLNVHILGHWLTTQNTDWNQRRFMTFMCRHFYSHVVSWTVVTTVSVFMQITAAFSVSGLRSTTLLLWHVSSDTRVTQPQQQIQQHHRDDSRTPWKNKIIFQESLWPCRFSHTVVLYYNQRVSIQPCSHQCKIITYDEPELMLVRQVPR